LFGKLACKIYSYYSDSLCDNLYLQKNNFSDSQITFFKIVIGFYFQLVFPNKNRTGVNLNFIIPLLSDIDNQRGKCKELFFSSLELRFTSGILLSVDLLLAN